MPVRWADEPINNNASRLLARIFFSSAHFYAYMTTAQGSSLSSSPSHGHRSAGKSPRLFLVASSPTLDSQRTPAPPLSPSSSRPARSSPLAGPALARVPSAASRRSRDDANDIDTIDRIRSRASSTVSFSTPSPESSLSSRRPQSSDGDRTKDKGEYPSVLPRPISILLLTIPSLSYPRPHRHICAHLLSPPTLHSRSLLCWSFNCFPFQLKCSNAFQHTD